MNGKIQWTWKVSPFWILFLCDRGFRTAVSASPSLFNFLRNVPPPGSGRFALYEITKLDERLFIPHYQHSLWFLNEAPLKVSEWSSDNASVDEEERGSMVELQSSQPVAVAPRALPHPHALLGPRVFNLPCLLSVQLGWIVEDDQGQFFCFRRSQTFSCRSLGIHFNHDRHDRAPLVNFDVSHPWLGSSQAGQLGGPSFRGREQDELPNKIGLCISGNLCDHIMDDAR